MLFYCEDGQTLEQVVQRNYGVCILGGFQNPTGHSSEQPTVAYPALNREPEQGPDDN